jgi:peptide/nickel transport system substrate-binding protein
MENRFGLRDLVLCSLLIVLIVSVWLSMKQVDRQWGEMAKISAAMDDQTKQLRRLGDLLQGGVSVTPQSRDHASTDNGKTAVPAFDRVVAPRSNPDFARGDWVIRAFGVSVGKLTPHVSSDIYQSLLEQFVTQSLAARDPDTLEWKPLIAKSWEVSEDGLTLTFELRRDVWFSDGEPLTADDVVYTYNLIMNPKIAAPRSRAYYEKVAAVEKDGDYRVVFTMREPYFKSFEFCGGMAILSKRFYSRFTPEQYNEMPGLLFGSGPYKLSVAPRLWKPGSGKIELVRNEQYWGEEPAIDRLVFQEITDDAARLTTFTNGELDRYGATPEQYLSLKNNRDILARANLFEYETVNTGYRYIAWNQVASDGRPSRFADKRVRQAMTMLTNRPQMCERLMVGLGTPATGPFHRIGKQASPDVKPWPYDPKRARALLEEAGFEDRDGDGVIEDADGEPFSFRLIYPASSANYQEMVFYLRDAYARAGIQMIPDPLEWTIMLQRIGQRDFDAMTLGWSGTPEGDPYQIFHSSQVGDGGDNYVHFINKELDGLIEQARVTMDADKRMPMWHRVHEILHEEQPYTFLFTSKSVTFVDKRFRNLLVTTLGLNTEVEWYVPRSLRRYSR